VPGLDRGAQAVHEGPRIQCLDEGEEKDPETFLFLDVLHIVYMLCIAFFSVKYT